MNIKDISLPAFIWYILPGINAILFVVVIPVSILDFSIIANNISLGSVLGWLFAGLIVGFLMDSTKLYKLTPGYKEKKDQFFRDFESALQDSNMRTYGNGKEVFRMIMLTLADDNGGFPLWEHSRWVMINHTSKAVLFSAIAWGLLEIATAVPVVEIPEFIKQAPGNRDIYLILILLFYLALGIRLHKESLKVLAEANHLYMTYLRIHRRKLIEFIENQPLDIHRQTNQGACRNTPEKMTGENEK